MVIADRIVKPTGRPAKMREWIFNFPTAIRNGGASNLWSRLCICVCRANVSRSSHACTHVCVWGLANKMHDLSFYKNPSLWRIRVPRNLFTSKTPPFEKRLVWSYFRILIRSSQHICVCMSVRLLLKSMYSQRRTSSIALISSSVLVVCSGTRRFFKFFANTYIKYIYCWSKSPLLWGGGKSSISCYLLEHE